MKTNCRRVFSGFARLGQRLSLAKSSTLARGLGCLAGALLLPSSAAAAERHNILLIIADDFSTDGLHLYNTRQCKGTLYEGGIRVPLIIAGPKVAGANRSTDAVASTVDLYATILELAGINLTATLPTNLPATSAFYHFSLRPVQASTNVSTGWKDWD